jgi:hypothetical protein
MSGANGATEFTDVVGTLDELRALMGEPSEIALRKDIGRLDEHCRAFKHLAVHDAGRFRRIMRRDQIAGDKPV